MKLYLFIRGSLEWPWNQYKFIAFKIFSCIISVIYFNILIIAVIPNEQQIN